MEILDDSSHILENNTNEVVQKLAFTVFVQPRRCHQKSLNARNDARGPVEGDIMCIKTMYICQEIKSSSIRKKKEMEKECLHSLNAA